MTEVSELLQVAAATPSARRAVTVLGHDGERYREIITPEALDFLRNLHRRFATRRNHLLEERFRKLRKKAPLQFLAETEDVRSDPDWRVASPAPGLEDRRVEICAPVERAIAQAALSSGAQVWVADFEDGTSPSWKNIIEGQLTVKDAVAGDLRPEDGSRQPTIVVRPRGWHLLERHIMVDVEAIPASLVDFGLFMVHNAKALVEQGVGPYLHLPKLESHLEARLWNDVFTYTEVLLELPPNSIRATVLVETIQAAFEMEEILYELREHAAGLSAGRSDFVFSIVKTLGTEPGFVLPDPSRLSNSMPFMKAFTDLLVQTCHKRGAYAIGGLSAFVATDDEAESVAQGKQVRIDKAREAANGFDGSWVGEASLVPLCREAFDFILGGATTQLEELREDVEVDAEDLLAVFRTKGRVTEAGVRECVSVLVRYLDGWLDGHGVVVLGGHMEDVAAAEAARCQLWQWMSLGTEAEGLGPVTRAVVEDLLDQELGTLSASRADLPSGRCDAIRDMVDYGIFADELPRSFTEYAYKTYLVAQPVGRKGGAGAAQA